MINRLRQYWYKIHTSFWFVPGLIILASMLLAWGFIKADIFITREVIADFRWLLDTDAQSARGLLGTIASSMITVAGVVFSITLVALSLASSQYSSRVLRVFVHDRGNQVVLGLFLGIFSYCLVVLRTIRSTDVSAYVPLLAVFFGLIFGFVGIAILVYFIHHIATSIQAARIVGVVFQETKRSIDFLFKEKLDRENSGKPIDTQHLENDWHAVPALQTGYIQQVDTTPLLEFARKHQAVVRMERGIGEFLIAGAPAFSIDGSKPSDEKTVQRLNSTFKVGRERTVQQDVSFGIRQLADVAIKALSPGINDNTTAVMCIDYLTAILVQLADRRIDNPSISDDGDLRVLLRGPTYSGLAGEAFKQIRQNADGKVAVMARLFQSFDILDRQTGDAKRRKVLLEHARDLAGVADRTLATESDRRYIKALAGRVIAGLEAEYAFDKKIGADNTRSSDGKA